jgi:hypothetical protein
MENIEQSPSKPGFFKHMFELAGEDKAELLNYLQYVLVALIPVVIILKLLRAYVPDEDPEQSALSTLGESLAQILVIFLSIWLIDRLVRYVPTYSGVAYKPMYLTNFIIAFLMVLLTMQSKLGSKINILVDKVSDLWRGETSLKEKPKAKTANAVAQQNASAPSALSAVATRQPIQSNLSQAAMLNNNLGVSAPQQQQMAIPAPMPTPDFNNMYTQDNIEMPGAQVPTAAFGIDQGPMAANTFPLEGFTGGAFGGSAY